MKAYEYMEHLFILGDERVRQFLFVGEKDALLMDTGFEDSHVYEQVRQITSLPVTVILTHADHDHCGGLADFDFCYVNERDWPLIKEKQKVRPLKEGDVFTCGDYCLEAIEIPGHTHGSVAFIERNKRLLFPGDSVQKEGPIYLFGAHRSLDAYIASFDKLMPLMDQVDLVFPCHHACPITPDYIEKNKEDAIALANHELRREKHPTFPCYTYFGKWTQFYYDR